MTKQEITKMLEMANHLGLNVKFSYASYKGIVDEIVTEDNREYMEDNCIFIDDEVYELTEEGLYIMLTITNGYAPTIRELIKFIKLTENSLQWETTNKGIDYIVI